MKSKRFLSLALGVALIAGGFSCGAKPQKDLAEVAATEMQEPEESSYALQGNDDVRVVDAATPDGVEIKEGGNLVAVLREAKDVSYEYNADSGIWAHIGNVSIIIDEDQLNQKGIDFLSTIYSDIEPNLQFSPDYVKPDAKILTIEKD